MAGARLDSHALISVFICYFPFLPGKLHMFSTNTMLQSFSASAAHITPPPLRRAVALLASLLPRFPPSPLKEGSEAC